MNQKIFQISKIKSEHMTAVKKGDTDNNELARSLLERKSQKNWDNKKGDFSARRIKETIHSTKDNIRVKDNNTLTIFPTIFQIFSLIFG